MNLQWVKWVAVFLGVGSVIQLFLDKYAVDYEEGEMAPNRWVCWGTCRPLSGLPEHTFRYVLIKLPSWNWEQSWEGDWRWYQRALWQFAGKWRMTRV